MNEDGMYDVRDAIPCRRAPNPPRKRLRLRGKTTGPATIARRRSEVRGEQIGISGDMYRRLVKTRAPYVLFNLFSILVSAVTYNNKSIIMTEYVSGKARIVAAFESNNFPAMPYDKENSPSQNILTEVGFLLSLQHLYGMVPHEAFSWFGYVMLLVGLVFSRQYRTLQVTTSWASRSCSCI